MTLSRTRTMNLTPSALACQSWWLVKINNLVFAGAITMRLSSSHCVAYQHVLAACSSARQDIWLQLDHWIRQHSILSAGLLHHAWVWQLVCSCSP